MEFIKNEDYSYIMKKYHPARFARVDEYFDANSGLDGEEIKKQILANDENSSCLPHAIRKANAFAFVLDNTRISCDNRDIFPTINAVDRPLNATIIPKWHNEIFANKICDVEQKRANYEKNGAITMWPDYDHSVPYWDRVFSLGFKGLLNEAENVRKSKTLNSDEDAFFEGIKISYEGILRFLQRLENQAKKDKNEKLENALCNIKNNPPSTFYEALLVDYIYFMLSEHIEGLQVRSLGNFDRLFYPFYIRDLQNGKSEDEIKRELAYFLLQFTAINNYWNQPVFLGGCKEDESTEINELSYLFLSVYDAMGIFNPKFQIKVAKSTPKEFLLKALDMVRKGRNSIAFVNDDVIRKSLVKGGATECEARLCNVKGCYEYSIQGGLELGMNYLNMLKPLEYAMHEGCDGVSGVFSGRKSPNVEEYKTFEEFYDEYKKQLIYLIDCTIETVNEFEDYLAYINPQSMLSATYPTCLTLSKDALAGGAKMSDSSINCGYIANVSDSLTNIKKYVFDKKALSLRDLKDMLDTNFENNEKWRRILLLDTDKYGNDKDLPDFFAKDITDLISNYVHGKKNSKVRGGQWICGFHVARMSYIQGKTTASSADGRKLGEELSKNVSASVGQNKEGATAAILSATKIDATNLVNDASLDLGLLPSAVKGEDGLCAMLGLLQTFIARGGQALQINVFNAEKLRDAQKYPEKYQDLQIRVSGWNVLWNNIGKDEQEGFIKQAESLV